MKTRTILILSTLLLLAVIITSYSYYNIGTFITEEITQSVFYSIVILGAVIAGLIGFIFSQYTNNRVVDIQVLTSQIESSIKKKLLSADVTSYIINSKITKDKVWDIAVKHADKLDCDIYEINVKIDHKALDYRDSTTKESKTVIVFPTTTSKEKAISFISKLKGKVYIYDFKPVNGLNSALKMKDVSFIEIPFENIK